MAQPSTSLSVLCVYAKSMGIEIAMVSSEYWFRTLLYKVSRDQITIPKALEAKLI